MSDDQLDKAVEAAGRKRVSDQTIDTDVDKIVSLYPDQNEIRKIAMVPDEDRFDRIMQKASERYSNRKPWEERDPRLAQFIGPIEDEEEDVELEDSDRTVRGAKEPGEQDRSCLRRIFGMRRHHDISDSSE